MIEEVCGCAHEFAMSGTRAMHQDLCGLFKSLEAPSGHLWAPIWTRVQLVSLESGTAKSTCVLPKLVILIKAGQVEATVISGWFL